MRLSRPAYRTAVIVHVLASVAWLGVSLSLLVLASVVATATEAPVQYAAATSAAAIAAVLPIPIGAIAIASGLILSVGTRWSLRYRWVMVKLVATCVAFVLTVVLLRPGLAALAAEVDPAALIAVDSDVMAGPIVSSGIYIGATVLSYVKPWGARGRPKRSGRAERPVPARSSR